MKPVHPPGTLTVPPGDDVRPPLGQAPAQGAGQPQGAGPAYPHGYPQGPAQAAPGARTGQGPWQGAWQGGGRQGGVPAGGAGVPADAADTAGLPVSEAQRAGWRRLGPLLLDGLPGGPVRGLALRSGPAGAAGAGRVPAMAPVPVSARGPSLGAGVGVGAGAVATLRARLGGGPVAAPGAQGGPGGPRRMRPMLAGPALAAARVRRPLGPEVTARLLIAVLLAAVQVVGTLATAPSHPHRPFPDAPVAALLLVAGPATFAASRRSVARAVVATASAAAYLALGYPPGAIGLTAVLGLLLAVLAGRQIEAWLVMASGVAGALVASRFGDHPLQVGATLKAAGWLVALLALAEVLRARRDAESVWSRARAQLRLRRAGEQRVEIARDLQDDVAHGLQLTAAHAAAGLALLDIDGARGAAQARAALLAIRDVADDALTELRVVTEVLAARGEQVPRPAPPGLEALTALAQRWAGTGLVVRAAGDPGPLPRVVDQLAFRVVQEALANVARHSCALHADLALHRDADLLTLVVSDPGPPRMGEPATCEAFLPGLGPELDGATPPELVPPGHGGADPAGAGQLTAGDWRVATADWDATWPTEGDGPQERGLTRMRERVEALGGAVSAGPDGAGWCVHVVLLTGTT